MKIGNVSFKHYPNESAMVGVGGGSYQAILDEENEMIDLVWVADKQLKDEE